MCDHAHRDEDGQEIQPHGEVRHPPVGLQRANLGEEETGDDKQQGADNVAQPELGHLRDVLAELDCNLTQEEQQAESLADVRDVAGRLAPGPHCEITIVARGEFVAVDAEEHAPDQIARIASHETEDGVEGDSCDGVSQPVLFRVAVPSVSYLGPSPKCPSRSPLHTDPGCRW